MKKRLKLGMLAAGLTLALGVPASALGVEVVVDTVKDAEIRQNQADSSNWGEAEELDVRSQASAANLQNRRAIVGFDFTDGTHLGCTVDSAAFEMYLNASNADRTHEVYPLTGEWAETTVTWNIAAGLTQGALASSANVTDGGTGLISWAGLASLVQGAIDDEGELTLLVKDSAEATEQSPNYNAQYASREGAAADETDTLFPPRLRIQLTCEECTEWDDETAWADGERYVDPGNWATYTAYSDGAEVTLYAGQAFEAGTVKFEADGGDVKITITLNAGYRFADVEENVKIQDYDDAPSGNPAPGGFDHKGDADPDDNTFEITVPLNNFYGVHVDLERCVDDEEEANEED
jgi:hypothetical protein